MVVIFSIESDTTTHKVMDWLHALHEPFMVIYPSDFAQKIVPLLRYFEEGNRPSIWFRKWANISNDMEYLNSEARKLIDYLFYITKGRCFWLNRPADYGSNNKLVQNSIAAQCGLRTASCDVVAQKNELLQILNHQPRQYITKSFGSAVERIDSNGDVYFAYTQMVDDVLVGGVSDRFFPSLVQQYIDKEFEIRTFFLDGQCYSMAIFSQENEKTKVDFRHYDCTKPNRKEPIVLPVEIENKLFHFAQVIGTNCGSFDLIRDKSGEIFFVEFNPLGQFGMVSSPCGYMLEKRVAELLKDKSGQCVQMVYHEVSSEDCGEPLCANGMQKMDIMGVDVCYRSEFYESDCAVVKFPFKPIDTHL